MQQMAFTTNFCRSNGRWHEPQVLPNGNWTPHSEQYILLKLDTAQEKKTKRNNIDIIGSPFERGGCCASRKGTYGLLL